MLTDGEFWSGYYRYLYQKGILNFVDIREDFYPFYKQGILVKVTWHQRMSLKEKSGINVLQNDEFDITINNNIVAKKLSKGSKVLELGCGSGWLCLELARNGYDVVGIDIALEPLRIGKEYSKRKGMENTIDYVQAHVSFLPFRKDVFEGLFSFHTIHHVPNLSNLCPELKRVLKQDGVLSIYEHRDNLLSNLGRIIRFLYSKILVTKYKPDVLFLRGFHAYRYAKSVCEDISVKQMDIVEKIFSLNKLCFFHFLNDLPLIHLFIFGEKRFVPVCRLVSLIYRLSARFIPSKSEFALYIGYNKKPRISTSDETCHSFFPKTDENKP